MHPWEASIITWSMSENNSNTARHTPVILSLHPLLLFCKSLPQTLLQPRGYKHSSVSVWFRVNMTDWCCCWMMPASRCFQSPWQWHSQWFGMPDSSDDRDRGYHLGTTGKITKYVYRHPALSLAQGMLWISSVEIEAPILTQSFATFGDSSYWMGAN